MTLSKHHLQLIVFLFFALFVFQCCTTKEDIFIVVGEHASKPEQITASHLKNDLEKVLDKQVRLIDEKTGLPTSGQIFLLGTLSSNRIIGELARKKAIFLSEDFPVSRGGIWATVNYQKQKMAVLAGSDIQGMQYAVYEYCENFLGVDPFSYWTGNIPKVNPSLNITNLHNKIIPPPQIPILCYFENDVDESANIKLPEPEYDWENYTEMINSLVRIKYNAIQLHDMLGRPDYNIRISYIDSMIDYAHDMGMKVQVDMALGLKIKPIAQDKADCWAKNKQEWLDTWKYYLSETSIGKADIFALRPHNQVWDREYKSSCGEDKVDVFNEVYAVLDDLIDEYKSGATKVVLCYHDGMEMFNNGFSPPKDWIIAWAGDGQGGNKHLQGSTKGYDFGTYMHAGFWLNYMVHYPSPVEIDSIMKMMVRNYQANKYCLVNGQQFRSFLLNIAAFSKLSINPELFNGEQFYQDWTKQYFGEEASPFAIKAMKKLHEAQFNRIGYFVHLREIKEVIAYLSNSPINRPGKPPIPYNYKFAEADYEHIEKRLEILNQALEFAEEGYEYVTDVRTFYHDYILLPINMYIDLLKFETSLYEMSRFKKMFELSGDKKYLENAISILEKARKELDKVNQRKEDSYKNKKWVSEYDPAKRHPNNEFPSPEKLDVIKANLNSKL